MTKFICTSKARLNQSIVYLSMEEENQGSNKQKIKNHLLIIHKQLRMSMKIWKIIKNRKRLIVFDDVVADMEANKKLESYSH